LNEALETLLNEESERLEFRSKVVTVYQNILDAIPAGVFGIDSNNVMALCNSTWIGIFGKSYCDLNRPVDMLYADDLARFIAEVNANGRAKKRQVVNGIKGVLSGVAMKDSDSQEGILLVFMREDDVC
jgi:PAS domain-containing protein